MQNKIFNAYSLEMRKTNTKPSAFIRKKQSLRQSDQKATVVLNKKSLRHTEESLFETKRKRKSSVCLRAKKRKDEIWLEIKN